MWKKDNASLEPYEESVVREGYIVASGVSVCYMFLRKEFNALGKDLFGDFFHMFKVNPENPLTVRSNCLNGKIMIHPISVKYEHALPGRIYSDPSVWNAAMFALVPGEDKSLEYSDSLRKEVFPESFVRFSGEKLPVTLISLLESSGVDFDGNYSHSTYAFVPAAQVGLHLFSWLTRKREVVSHEHTFKQQTAGVIEIPATYIRPFFFERIVPPLENKFGEKIIFSRKSFS